MTDCRIVCGDALEQLTLILAGSVDLVFADLPYGRTQNKWDEIIPIQPLWQQLHRVCKPTAAMVFTAMQPFTSLLVTSNLREFRYEMIWRKNKASGGLNAKKQPLRAHESVLVFYREQPRYAPSMTTGHRPANAAPNRGQSSKCYGAQRSTPYVGGHTARYPTSVLDIPVVNNDSPERIHSTQKPVALVEWFIRAYTQSEGLVLDPACGSGTTVVAAAGLGRCAVGIEKDAEMADKAAARVRAAEAARNHGL